MNELSNVIEEYIALRRSLGFKLHGVARGLRNFAAFAAHERVDHVTVEGALRWALQTTGNERSTAAARLRMVTGFARWRQATDPRTEVPPPNLLPTRYHRKRPYIYTDDQISQLVVAAHRLPSPSGLRGLTVATIIGLLAVTGMRVSEAVALDRADVDLEDGILSIRQSKFRKSRLVAVHPSTRLVLTDYAATVDRLVRRRATAPAFFVSERGARFSQWAVGYGFAKVSGQIGLRAPIRGHRYGHGPRLHDLRHRFAAQTLVAWYRAGLDVERELPRLATYLGHVHVNETYWYLEAVPELLELATQRLLDRRTEVDA